MSSPNTALLSLLLGVAAGAGGCSRASEPAPAPARSASARASSAPVQRSGATEAEPRPRSNGWRCSFTETMCSCEAVQRSISEQCGPDYPCCFHHYQPNFLAHGHSGPATCWCYADVAKCANVEKRDFVSRVDECP